MKKIFAKKLLNFTLLFFALSLSVTFAKADIITYFGRAKLTKECPGVKFKCRRKTPVCAVSEEGPWNGSPDGIGWHTKIYDPRFPGGYYSYWDENHPILVNSTIDPETGDEVNEYSGSGSDVADPYGYSW